MAWWRLLIFDYYFVDAVSGMLSFDLNAWNTDFHQDSLEYSGYRGGDVCQVLF